MREISAQELEQLIESRNDIIILDCRSEIKHKKEHIPGTINLPLSKIEEDYKNVIPDKNSLIITSCESFLCETSTKCYEKLRSLGYANLREFTGGLADWKANGFKTAKVN